MYDASRKVNSLSVIAERIRNLLTFGKDPIGLKASVHLLEIFPANHIIYAFRHHFNCYDIVFFAI